MTHVELTRPLADYFAFAELERHGETRRFTMTLPYLRARQLGRLQWWWRITETELNVIGDAGLEARRQREIVRFQRHVERWLTNTDQRMHGDGPIPEITPLPASQATDAAATPAGESSPAGERRYA
ncbi:MAG TPA: hypothetical protein VE046_08910 [Steroidobacteraceae bacterium]|nr:hypothetical protein [Steroidobacteraceae bacterium]